MKVNAIKWARLLAACTVFIVVNYVCYRDGGKSDLIVESLECPSSYTHSPTSAMRHIGWWERVDHRTLESASSRPMCVDVNTMLAHIGKPDYNKFPHHKPCDRWLRWVTERMRRYCFIIGQIVLLTLLPMKAALSHLSYGHTNTQLYHGRA
jgi:hypothetical protein